MSSVEVNCFSLFCLFFSFCRFFSCFSCCSTYAFCKAKLCYYYENTIHITHCKPIRYMPNDLFNVFHCFFHFSFSLHISKCATLYVIYLFDFDREFSQRKGKRERNFSQTKMKNISHVVYSLHVIYIINIWFWRRCVCVYPFLYLQSNAVSDVSDSDKWKNIFIGNRVKAVEMMLRKEKKRHNYDWIYWQHANERKNVQHFDFDVLSSIWLIKI